MDKLKEIGNFCRDFRKYILLMTLQDISDMTGTNIKTLSAFENGRSTNILHLKDYLTCSTDYNHRVYLVSGIVKILEV